MTKPKLTEYQTHLVETHIKLAQRLGLEAWRRSPEAMEKYEVVGIAYQGLIAAAVRFDPDWRPPDDPAYDPFLAFGSFARRRISGAILDWQRSQDHVPKRQRQTYKSLQQHGLGLGKTPEQLADLTGLAVDKIRAVTQAVEATAISLDQPESSLGGSSYAELPAAHNVEESALVLTIQQIVADTINSMPPLQRSVVVLRYYSGFDLSQIAAELGVGASVVRTVHKEAVDTIHVAMRRAAS